MLLYYFWDEYQTDQMTLYVQYSLVSVKVFCLISWVHTIHSRKNSHIADTRSDVNGFTCIFLINLHNSFSNHHAVLHLCVFDYDVPSLGIPFLLYLAKLLLILQISDKEFPPLEKKKKIPPWKVHLTSPERVSHFFSSSLIITLTQHLSLCTLLFHCHVYLLHQSVSWLR